VNLGQADDCGKTSTLKCVFMKSIKSLYVLMFPRYFRYSIGSTGRIHRDGGHTNINSLCSRQLLTSLLC